MIGWHLVSIILGKFCLFFLSLIICTFSNFIHGSVLRLSPPSPGGAGRRGVPSNSIPANAASRAPPPPPTSSGRPAPAIPNRPGPEQGRQPPAPPGRPGGQGLPPPLIPS